MANENKNINELVSEPDLVSDDDPTAELEVLSFDQFDPADIEAESDSNTFGFGDDAEPSESKSIPELQSDLERRTRTIGRLQYDIEQLRSKWLGLETEIKAREEIVSNLSGQIDELGNVVARKDKLLNRRQQKIKSLKQTIVERDETQALQEQQNAELRQQLEEQNTSSAAIAASLEETERELENKRSALEAAEADVASLESTNGEQHEAQVLLEQQRTELEQQLAEHATALADKERELQEMRSDLEATQEHIESLRSDIGLRDESQELLGQKHAELDRKLAEREALLEEKEHELEKMHSRLLTTQNQSAADLVLTQQTSAAAVKDAQAQLARAETYADSLRYKLQEFAESQTRLSKERDRLIDTVDEANERNWASSEKLESVNASMIELHAALRQQHADHAEEISTLRSELGQAQDSLAETGELNKQLTTDLIDTRAFKKELERMLCESEEASQKRISELENQLGELVQTTEDLQQRLETKTTAVNVLLGELEKKSAQIQSIGEIESVIHELDDRISERFDESNSGLGATLHATAEGSDHERITRVLIGSVDDQELRFPLFKNRLTIGRNQDNDIQLDTTYVSRRHAVMLTEGDATRVIDWGSKNGVFVNSERVKEHFLSNGDIVAIGDVKFRYEERPKHDA